MVAVAEVVIIPATMTDSLAYITRREQFNAAHRLFREDYSDEKNSEVFGKCSNPLWHGHNYTLWVTVKGPVNQDTGFVMNLRELSQIIRKEVVDKLDHRNINLEVDFMKGKLASTENLVVSVFRVLEQALAGYHGVALHCVKIQETENNSVEYYG